MEEREDEIGPGNEMLAGLEFVGENSTDEGGDEYCTWRTGGNERGNLLLLLCSQEKWNAFVS